MEPRQLVAERGLVPAAVSALTRQAFMAIPVESVGPTKALLKRFFSTEVWGEADDEALAAAVGPGEGWWHERLDDELALEFGWVNGLFQLRVEGDGATGGTVVPDGADALAATFAGPVVPEATPNPRTLAFRTGPIHDGESRSYSSIEEADDPRVARLFRCFSDLVSVMVAQDFVAVSLRRPDRWNSVLAPMLQVVTEEFAKTDAGTTPAGPGPSSLATDRPASAKARANAGWETRLERAWRELGTLKPSEPADLERVIVAASDPDPARRQVAASLLGQTGADVAQTEWDKLASDPSRSVRRAALDAMVDAGREGLRPLLERALGDGDAWVRWKALRGLNDLGPAPSEASIRQLLADPDVRVRLEARAALRPPTEEV